MPFYEYHCPRCDASFTLIRAIAARDEPAECPDCGAVTGEREVSAFSTGGTVGAAGSGASAGGCGSGFS